MGRRKRKRRTEPARKISTGKTVHQLPIRVEKLPGRNVPCPCGSGKKYKQCHGKPVSQPIHHTRGGYTDMRALYTGDQREAEKKFVRQWGFTPNPSQLLVFTKGDPGEIKEMVLGGLRRIAEREGQDFGKFEFAINKLGRLVTPANQKDLSDEEQIEWEQALEEYEQLSTATTEP